MPRSAAAPLTRAQDTPEAEYAECKGSGDAPFLPAPRHASETFRASVAEVAARFEDDFAGAPHTDPYAFAAHAEPAPFEITPAPAFEPALTPQYTEAAPPPPPELYPSLIAAGAPPSPPPSPPPPPPPPSPPSPPPKSAHETSDFEHALDDIAAQPVTFPTPAPFTQYLHGAVTFLKSAVLAVASAGVYFVALPWACIVLGLRGFRGRDY